MFCAGGPEGGREAAAVVRRDDEPRRGVAVGAEGGHRAAADAEGGRCAAADVEGGRRAAAGAEGGRRAAAGDDSSDSSDSSSSSSSGSGSTPKATLRREIQAGKRQCELLVAQSRKDYLSHLDLKDELERTKVDRNLTYTKCARVMHHHKSRSDDSDVDAEQSRSRRHSPVSQQKAKPSHKRDHARTSHGVDNQKIRQREKKRRKREGDLWDRMMANTGWIVPPPPPPEYCVDEVDSYPPRRHSARPPPPPPPLPRQHVDSYPPRSRYARPPPPPPPAEW